MICYIKDLSGENQIETSVGVFAPGECAEESALKSACFTWVLSSHYEYSLYANSDGGMDQHSSSTETLELAPSSCLWDGEEVIGFYYNDHAYLIGDPSTHKTVDYSETNGTGIYGGDESTTVEIRLLQRDMDLTKLLKGRKKIRESEFEKVRTMEKAIIPHGVQTIGKKAFWYCDGLTEVVISDSVKEIGDGAFRGCERIKTVKIGDGVERIGSYAFSNCHGMTKLILGKSVKEIEQDAFLFCWNLTEIVFPEGMVFIDKGAFYGCRRLAWIVLPKGVVTKQTAFKECPLDHVFYMGTREEHEQEYKQHTTCFYPADEEMCYYADEPIAERQDLWHFVDGEPALW